MINLKLYIIIILVIILVNIFIHKYNKPSLVLQLKNTNYDYTFEKYYINNNKNCYPSSYIFEIFTKNKYNNIYNQTIKIQKYFGVNKTVYGIKKVKDEYLFEYYYSYYNENKLHNIQNIFKLFKINNRINFENYCLISFELINNNIIELSQNINEINIYYLLNNCNHKTPILFHNFTICKQCLSCMNKTYNINNNTIIDKNIYKNFPRNTSNLTEIYNYTKTLIGNDVDLNLIFTPYLLSCKKNICVAKKPNSIGFYFSLVPFDDFIIFLEKSNFNEELRYKLIENNNKLSYLLFDIGFDIIIKEDNNIIFNKLSFYGIL